MQMTVLAVALLSILPALHAQQSATSAEQQPTAQTPNAQTDLPADIRPGHPLDPADVEVLTGKRDREMEAARRAAVPALAGAYGEYGNYGDYFWMNGRLGGTWDMPMLPLARISNPFFFGFSRGGFGRGFGRGGFRGPR